MWGFYLDAADGEIWLGVDGEGEVSVSDREVGLGFGVWVVY